jgi:ABC-type transporter MlaC component
MSVLTREQLTWKSLLIKMLEKYENKFKERKLEALYAELLTKLNPAHVANKPVPVPSAEDYALVAQEIQDILGEEVRCI